MSAWCMAHPWMTFWLILFVGMTLAEAIGEWGKRR